MLLLQEDSLLLDSLPVDCTPALSRLIQVANPIRSLQTLALEADLSLFQVRKWNYFFLKILVLKLLLR